MESAIRGTRWLLLTLAALSAASTLAVVEIAARVWVALRWPPEKTYELTHLTESRGRFHTHPELPYALTPGFSWRGFRQNSLGFRGPELSRARTPGVRRVALLGASSVYGIYAEEGQTAADRLHDELERRGLPVEVVNAGVPGWTSKETSISFRSRILPLEPDIVVLMDGRNDAFPQLYRGFVPDYSHYRISHYEVRLTNARWKRVFHWSHALMTLVSRGELFGFSLRAEHPDYGSIRMDNMPTPDEALRAADDSIRFETFHALVRSVIAEARARGIVPVLAVVPFRPEGWASGTLPDMEYVPAVTRAIRANLDFVRSLAASEGIPLVETSDLLRPEWMHDDCHFNVEGEARLGSRYADVLEPVLRAIAPPRAGQARSR